VPAGVLRGAVEGAVITGVRRRGKYILLDLSRRPSIAVHLGMSGSLLLSVAPLDSPHLRAAFHFAGGGRLNFVDPRTFGTLFPLAGEIPRGFRSLGAEPLSSSFTAAELEGLLSHRRAPVKALLLRQDLVAGIGNIYAGETLFRARISPFRAGGDLSRAEVRRLHRAMRAVLREAIGEMGTTLSDFRRPDGEPGKFANRLHVYGRAGKPCPRCGTPVERATQHGRSTFFCPRCQLPPGRG